MSNQKELPPNKIRAPERNDKTKDNVSLEIGGDVQNANIVIGDNNQITTNHTVNRVRNITKIIKTASPREYIVYTSIFLIVLVILLYAFWYNNLRYDRAIASGQINVLIVPFVEKHAWGFGKSDLGWSIAQILADGVKRSFSESGIDTAVTILGPSDKVPTIFGVNETYLERSAETVSEKISGQIVIYGVITPDDYGDSIITVKFYISPINFGEAQELISDSIVGDLSLGSFRLTGDTVSGTDLLAQNVELRDRLYIFSAIINFLGAYLGEDFDLARQYIEKAGDQALWGNTNGLEVVHLIHGNMELRQARALMVNKDLNGTMDAIKVAKVQFSEAMNVSIKNGNGSYARAYLGMAGAESLSAIAEANITGDVSLINEAALKQSLEQFDNAASAEYRPETADIDAKVNYGRAQIALAFYAKTGNRTHLDTAKSYYQSVVAEYEKTNNNRIIEYAALSYTGLGHIAAQNGQYTTAIEHFQSAQKTTHNPSLKIQCLANLGDIYYEDKKYSEALKYYEDALDRAGDLRNALSEERIIELEGRINLIQDGRSL